MCQEFVEYKFQIVVLFKWENVTKKYRSLYEDCHDSLNKTQKAEDIYDMWIKKFLDDIWEVYGKFTARELEDINLQEYAICKTREGLSLVNHLLDQ